VYVIEVHWTTGGGKRFKEPHRPSLIHLVMREVLACSPFGERVGGLACSAVLYCGRASFGFLVRWYFALAVGISCWAYLVGAGVVVWGFVLGLLVCGGRCSHRVLFLFRGL